MDALVLGGLVKRLYPNFSMQDFNNRLRIQKLVFIMRAAGLDLGYHYSLYIRGPYSPDLARDAYIIEDWNAINPAMFASGEQEAKFTKVLQFVTPHRNDCDWLEIVSTLLMIKEINSTASKDEIVARCKEVKSRFSKTAIQDAYDELVTAELIA